MHPVFDEALTRAVPFLRELTWKREDIAEARLRLERFRQAHPNLRADLLIDQPPGSPRVDYDLLLGHPDGGTVALAYRADAGVPWSVDYADHWAANYVVSVNDHHCTVQEALLFLKSSVRDQTDLMNEIVNQKLIEQAIEENPPSVGDDEIQAAADEFRAASGLYSAEATHRWLQEMGLSEERFQNMATWRAQARKLEERVTEDQVESYFIAHRESFDLVQFFRVDTPTETIALQLMKAAQHGSLMAATHERIAGGEGRGLEGALVSQQARELPSELATAPTGAVEGPVAEKSGHWVAQVLNRQPAQLDDETRAAIRGILFQKWLADQREQATVRWHWM